MDAIECFEDCDGFDDDFNDFEVGAPIATNWFKEACFGTAQAFAAKDKKDDNDDVSVCHFHTCSFDESCLADNLSLTTALPPHIWRATILAWIMMKFLNSGPSDVDQTDDNVLLKMLTASETN